MAAQPPAPCRLIRGFCDLPLRQHPPSGDLRDTHIPGDATSYATPGVRRESCWIRRLDGNAKATIATNVRGDAAITFRSNLRDW